ncbi:Catalytic protein [Mycena venus]|uniref:Catalytic protein n=1 Tax=Mycena venus TaxID=2733690 RepID=A0A8H6Y4R4_9AGAR|nr:Catalytic protein [Mycena venus]
MTDLAVAVRDVLIVVFIHGFKGTDTTFGEFPGRLQHILTETIPNASVECIVFPAYETKGDLTEAVVKFADWLTTLTVEREVASGGGAGRAKLVLCGHRYIASSPSSTALDKSYPFSMGGLLAADTLREFLKGRKTQPEFVLWPKIIGIIAFDTPYLGLHPGVFKNSATKAVEYAQAARNVGTGLLGALAGFGASKAPPPPPSTSAAPASGWGKWAGTASYAVGGALLAGAAAGASYYKREDLGLGYSWATDHMKYVSHLWNVDSLNQRVDFLVHAQEQEGVVFRNFYTYLPPTPLLSNSERTFIVLPKKNAPAGPHFVLARNGLASDEVEAHTGMFSGKTNDGYYDLGLQTAQVIREAVMIGRGSVPVDTASPELVDTTSPEASSELVDTTSPEASPKLVNTITPEAPSAPIESKPFVQSAEMAEWGKEWQ